MTIPTQPLPTALAAPAAPPAESSWRWSVDQYHAIIRAGILTDDDPVELLEGMLVRTMPKNPPHRIATRLLRLALERAVPGGWYVDTQEPITTADSEPESDLVVVRGETRTYADRHPGPADVALVVEVADATLQRDRMTKKRLYASAAIVAYWIVNLSERQVEVYTEPSGPAEVLDYQRRQDYGLDAEVPVLIEGQEVARLAVRDVLP